MTDSGASPKPTYVCTKCGWTGDEPEGWTLDGRFCPRCPYMVHKVDSGASPLSAHARLHRAYMRYLETDDGVNSPDLDGFGDSVLRIIQDVFDEHGDTDLELAALQAQVAELTRALNQQGHIAEFREDGYGLEHPVECRVAGLLNCAVDKACRYEQAPPAIGRYRVSIDAEGFLILEERVE